MAVEHDDPDNVKLATIGLVGAIATAAISYLAAGMYHERVQEIRAAEEQTPALEEAQQMEAAQQPAGIEQAMKEIAEGK